MFHCPRRDLTVRAPLGSEPPSSRRRAASALSADGGVLPCHRLTASSAATRPAKYLPQRRGRDVATSQIAGSLCDALSHCARVWTNTEHL